MFQVRFGAAAAAGLAMATLLAPRAAAAPRTLSFRVNEACTCAECSFEAQRELPKFAGVKKTTLDPKSRRLDVVFDEGTQPVSALAQALTRLDVGKGSALLWPVRPGTDVERTAKDLARVPGIKTATPDPKARTVAVVFAGKPAVALAQLDSAASGSADARS